jgi:hypothetical protein
MLDSEIPSMEKTVNRNPWHRLPDRPPYVLPEDLDKVAAFNDKVRHKYPGRLLILDLIPVPFMGRPDAPVVLLGNISGSGGERPEDYLENPSYAERMRKNLVHGNSDFQFLPLDPSPDTFPEHKQWWSRQLRHLLAEFGGGKRAECILSRSVLAVEYLPYRSSDNRYAHKDLDLSAKPSQLKSWKLVYDAMKNDAVIVIRYGKALWFDAVRGLEKYQHTLLLRGIERTQISPTGFVEKDGYQKVVEKLKASSAYKECANV